MSTKRRKFSPEFKTLVVLEVLRGEKKPAVICREHNLSPELLRRWRHQFTERAHLVFDSDAQQSEEQARIAELERLVGKLTFELVAVKKISQLLNLPSTRSVE